MDEWFRIETACKRPRRFVKTPCSECPAVPDGARRRARIASRAYAGGRALEHLKIILGSFCYDVSASAPHKVNVDERSWREEGFRTA